MNISLSLSLSDIYCCKYFCIRHFTINCRHIRMTPNSAIAACSNVSAYNCRRGLSVLLASKHEGKIDNCAQFFRRKSREFSLFGFCSVFDLKQPHKNLKKSELNCDFIDENRAPSSVQSGEESQNILSKPKKNRQT